MQNGNAGFPQNKSRLPRMSEWSRYKSEESSESFVNDVTSMEGEKSRT